MAPMPGLLRYPVNTVTIATWEDAPTHTHACAHVRARASKGLISECAVSHLVVDMPTQCSHQSEN